MAFPTVIAEAGGSAGNSTSISVNIPDGSNVAGRRIIVFLNSDGAETFTFPAGWTQLYTHSLAAQTTDAWYHDTDGTEGYPGTGATITVGISTSESTAHISYLLGGFDTGTAPAAGTSASGGTTTPDPPALDPAGWATEDTLWFAVASSNGGTFSAGPASYTNFRTEQSGAGAADGVVATARRENAVESENPGTFTKDSAAQWTANTIAVRPSAGTSVAISGNAATSAVGTLALALSLALGGVAATAEVGSLTPGQALDGVVATGSTGTTAPNIALPLTGAAATGSVGSVVYSAGGDLSLAVSGVTSTGAPGAASADRSMAAAGVAAASGIGSLSLPSYVAKGTAQAYNLAGVASLTIANVTLAAGETLILAVASDQTLGLSATWGATALSVVASTQLNGAQIEIWAAYSVPAGTNDVVWTADTQTNAIAMSAAEIERVVAAPQDKLMTATGTSTTPSSGSTAATTWADEILLGAIATEGPDGDAPGTWDSPFIAGQRLGTTAGASPDLNITVSDGYRIVAEIGAYAASKTGITSRDWAAAILTLRGGNPTAPSTAIGLAGTAATSAAGTLGPAVSLAITGVASSGAVGSVGVQIGGDLNLALGGVVGSGSAGTVIPGIAVTLTGVSATGAVGSVVPTQVLAGVSATGAVGTVVAQIGGDVNIPLTGVASTGSVGSVTPPRTVALAGAAGAAAVGSVTPTRAITGNASTGAAGSLAPSVSVAITGVAATGAVGTIIATTPTDVTRALTGVSATGIAGQLLRVGPPRHQLGPYTIETLIRHKRYWTAERV